MFKLSNFWAIEVKNLFKQTFQENFKELVQANANFRLLIVTQFYPPDYAATGQLIQELSTQLSKENIQVSVFTGQPGYAFKQKQAPTYEENGLLRIKRSRAAQFWSKRVRGKTLNGIFFCVRALLHLLRSARKNDIVLLTTAPPFLSTVGYIANLLFKLDYVCLVYDLYPEVAIELDIISPEHPITKLWHKLNSLVWQRSKKIVVLSDTMKERIVARHPQVADKISIIHNWANADWIVPMAKKHNWFARQHGMDCQFTVLYSGNLGRCHDLETILGTIKLLKKESVRFVFIGAGAKHDLCRQTVAELKLNNCIFLPYQDRKNLPYSLTACDLALVSIAPGLEGVVAPSKLYGIMAAGRAIAAICEPHSYLRNLISDANCGACFDNNSSESLAEFILTLSNNPRKAIELGDAGRKYMEQYFTPRIIAKQYSEVLAPTSQSAFVTELSPNNF
ncbi:glycosyltransferase family 4 protein [Myxosarcina sp. GI1]|uniref:glycosyltransferase family 4 protein n=1 Tax=Myxosarcina sp. GI1 TaxID=1541065 RepID=UPI000A967041|nr:glycosyltransferase family 4 protein [Myxosarcina sp. GI1]